MAVVAERHQIVRTVRASVLALDDVVDLKFRIRSALAVTVAASVLITPPDILLDVVESVLRPLLLPDAFDIRILDPVYVELSLLYGYA